MLNYYNTGEDILKKSDIYINRVRVTQPTGYHAHNFIEIAYIEEGSGIHRIGESEFACSSGDLFILDYDVPHQFSPNINSSMVVNNCIFKPSFIDYSLVNSRNFADITHNFLLRPFFTDDFKYSWTISITGSTKVLLDDIYNKMLKEYEETIDGYTQMLRAYLIELLISIFRFIHKSGKYKFKSYDEKDKIINNITSYIESNFANDITLDKLSMIAFLSPSYFCKLFKDSVGMTVKEFTQKVRIDEACRLLKQSSCKVIDIASEVGYSDVKYFNMVFKRVTGNTPSEFRKKG